MNTKQCFGLLKQFSFIKLLNVLVIFSMILTSCGSPTEQAAEEKEVQFFRKELKWNNYEPPVYTHPEPVVGERPTNNGQIVPSSTQNDMSSIMFVENIGQFGEGARFQAESELGTIYLADDAVWITLLETSPKIGSEAEDLSATSTSVPSDPQIPPTPTPVSNDPQIPPTTTPDNDGNTIVGVNLRLSFEGANRNSRVEGFDPLDSTISYFAGNDLNNWSADALAWNGVRYVDFYPGYNLEIISKAGDLYWRFVQSETSSIESKAAIFKVAAPAKIINGNEIRLRIEGADSLTLNENTVQINTMAGSISLPLPELATSPSSLRPDPDANSLKPILDGNEIILPFELPVLESLPTSNLSPNSIETSVFYSESDAATVMEDMQANRPVAGSSRSRSATLLPENLSTSDTVKYSTYIPGSANDIVVDNYGSVYIVGDSSSVSFPTTPGAFTSSGSGMDIFVSKLSPGGEFVEFSTIIGGDSTDNGYGIAIDDMQNIYITGRTFSTNLPVTSGAYDTTNSGSEAFVIKLNPTGTNLVYATYLGNGGVQGFDIAVNNNGEAYVVGQTISVSFPTTTGAYDRINNGWDGFVTRFNATGSGLIFSTYLGGTADDCEISTDRQECSIALDSSRAVYIAGHTLSSDFPTTVGAYDRIYNSNFDMFVSKLQPNGSALIYSTFLGGSGNDWCMPECGIDVDKDGYAYIVGTTSGNFPTTVSAYDRIYNGGSSDLVIVKLTQNGGGVVYSTYLGESGSDTGHAITVENGFAMVTGETTSANFPFTPDAFQETFGGGTRDAFVTFLDLDGGGFVYSTYLGGSGDEFGLGISSTPNGNIAATGVTGSNNFPTTSGTYANSYVTNFNFATSIIFDPSVLNNCYGECYESAATNSNGIWGGPINTRTGGLFYQTEDIYVPTTSKPLTFHRTYSSLATDLYPTTLGYGWTHSLESRLIFPGDPGGEAGYLLFKLHTANRYQFIINEDGTYSSAPGVTGTMTYTGGIYALTLPDQSIYTFDVNGRLQTWADVEEHLWNYSYNANNQLEQISADSGTRYFTIILNTVTNCGFKLELFGNLVRLVNDHPTSTYARDFERNSLSTL